MKKLYNKIKQTARKYTLPAIVAGSLVLGSCNRNSLPLEKNVQQSVTVEQQKEFDSKIKNLDYLVSVAENYTKESKRLFNEGVERRNIDSLTMENILRNYKKADELYSKIFKKADEYSDTFWNLKFSKKDAFWKYAHKKLSKEDKKLMKKCNHALHGIDFGKAELQKELKRQGLKVEVYNSKKPEDKLGWAIFISIMLAGLMGGSTSRG